MENIIGTSNKILEIDLSSKTFDMYTVSKEERKMYIGGKGLGLKLLYERMPPKVDPLGPDNIIAFMPGVLMGTGAPCSGRFAAVTKSPLTGLMASSTCGGPFGMELKTAGWDGLLIKGQSDTPLIIEITSSNVQFKDASGLWGKEISEAQQMLGKKGKALIIGPAGENLVRYANIASRNRFLGRAGMGAVMGAKKLKAILAFGKVYKIQPANQTKFEKVSARAAKYINDNPNTAIANREFGTPSIVNWSNASGILPVRNFTEGTSDSAYKLSGEEIKRKFSPNHHPCKGCIILCGKQAVFNGQKMNVPEYETLGLLGANLGIFDPEHVARWNHRCGELGMDTMSVGGTLAWVMEATEKGLVESKLKFGSPDNIDEALDNIVYGRGLGKDMAMGTKGISELYGGKEFAMHVKGLEIAAYDPRGSYGTGLGYAVANRGGCHLAATMMVHENNLAILDPYQTYGKAHWVAANEDLWACINSLQTCLFTSYAYLNEQWLLKFNPWIYTRFTAQYLPQVSLKITDNAKIYRLFWEAVTGIKISKSDFLKAGKRICVLERYMNTREGISRKDDTLPARLLTEGRTCDAEKRTVPLEKMLNDYYKIRGYTPDGKPTQTLLAQLGITPTPS